MIKVKVGNNSEVANRIANRSSICPLQCYSARGDTELANEIAITVVDSVANEIASGSQTNECNCNHDKRPDNLGLSWAKLSPIEN